jgi:hypothetical protein
MMLRHWLHGQARVVMRGHVWLHAVSYAVGRRKMEESAMSATSSTQCTACHHGELTPTRLTVTLTYGGKSCSVDDDDALACDARGEELIGERVAAFLLTQRALAPHAEMTATVRRRAEIV